MRGLSVSVRELKAVMAVIPNAMLREQRMSANNAFMGPLAGWADLPDDSSTQAPKLQGSEGREQRGTRILAQNPSMMKRVRFDLSRVGEARTPQLLETHDVAGPRCQVLGCAGAKLEKDHAWPASGCLVHSGQKLPDDPLGGGVYNIFER
jgi:hypothetical protein